MSLSIEFAAYDLYRSMAHRFSGTPVEGPFLAIAQAEKEHMRIASEALQFCE
jgi:sulfur-carrier protein adenylyltransferase/sulfurtransferase